MKSITIHGIDGEVDQLIQRQAQEWGLSLNKTIKRLLAQALGRTIDAREMRRKSFEEFFGIWDKKDLIDFKRNLQDFDQINPADW